MEKKMRLHLFGVGDNALNQLENAYVAPAGPMFVDQMNQKNNTKM